MQHQQHWPDVFWLVRHGESAGNVARDLAEASQQHLIDIATRDADTPLSELGTRQAIALGRWFATQPADQRPNVVLVSPYIRAIKTAELILQHAGVAGEQISIEVDERLREKEFGILDRFTVHGILAKFPELAELRSRVGKFYFRPPGGESWCDVVLRLRSVIDTITREYRGDRVLMVAHQVIVNCFRYLLEKLDEERILAIDRAADVPNCGVTRYVFDPAHGKSGDLRLAEANFTAPLEASHTPITTAADAPAGPK